MYQYKELYTIDFSGVEHYLEMHMVIRDVADKLVDILKEFTHCDDDEYSDEIRIEIVSGENRISIT